MIISLTKYTPILCLLVGLAFPLHAETASDTPALNEGGVNDGRDASFLPLPTPGLPASSASSTEAPLALMPPQPNPLPSTSLPSPAVPPPPPVRPALAVAPILTAPAPAPPNSEKTADLGKPIEAGPLGDINPESIGLLSSNDGGLGATLWKGTPRALVERLMPALNLPTLSPALNDLARRFLLTTATVPLGPAEAAQSLTSMRIERLMALGEVAAAWKLAQLSKPDQVDELTMRLVAEAGLDSSARDDVCAKLPEIMQNHTAVEWQKLLLVCQLRAGDMKAVQISLDLLHAQNVKDDTYFELIEKNIIATRKQLPRQLTPLKPLTLAVLRVIDLPLTSEVYVHPDAALIPELLQAKAREDGSRLALAERAAERGLLTSSDLENIYSSVSFTADNLANALNSPETGPRLHALLYQAAVKEQTEQKRLDYTWKFLQSTTAGLLSGPGASVLADMIGSIQPTADFYASSSKIAEINMLAGKPDAALEWLKLAKRGAIGMPLVASDLLKIWPLIVFSGLQSDNDYEANFAVWLDSMLKPLDPKSDMRLEREQASLIMMLLEATGFTISDDAWAKVIDAPSFDKRSTPSPLLYERLRASSLANHRGEAVLESLLLMGGGMGPPSAFTTIETVRGLRLVGLGADAALLARESALSLLVARDTKP